MNGILFSSFCQNGRGLAPILFLCLFSIQTKIVFAANQTDSMVKEMHTQAPASELSLQNSTTSAMAAVISLADSNIPGAVTHGYRSFNQYTNSQTLDLNSKINLLSAMRMATPGAGPMHEVLDAKLSGASYGSLNPAFLYQGEAGRIASEFERRTGMARKDFQSYLDRTAGLDISMSDPNLLKKVSARFDDFVQHIPNKEFRGQLTKNASLVSGVARNNIVAKAISGVGSMLASFTGGTSKTTAVVASRAASSETPPTRQNAPRDTIAASRTPAATTATGKSMLGLGSGENPLWENMERAIASKDGEEESIFQQVSRRYSLLTARLNN